MIVSISASAFDQWIGALDGGSALSMRQIGKMSGVSSGHLSVSRTRGVMPSAAVLGVAQSYGLDPLEEIARFPGFDTAWPAPKLKADQCLVLVPTLELIIELLWRGRELEMDDRKESHEVAGDALVRWADRAFVKTTKQEVAAAIGVNRVSMTKQLDNGKMPIDRIFAICGELKTHPGLPLVAAGHIGLEHIGWSIDDLLVKATAPQILDELRASQRHVEDALNMLVFLDEVDRKLG